MKVAVALCLLCLLCACSHSGRYQQASDSMPEVLPRDLSLADAEPRYLPYYPPSLRPYKVLGKHYQPLTTAKGYQAIGMASWYGEKFHGHLTANGERYNMYTMSAAHKTLPLPAFVRVTNLENHRQTIVRVNDRGPFHPNRVIDLSYAAALKLGFMGKGVAKVRLEVMHVDQQGQLSIGNQPVSKSKQLYIQVAAIQDGKKAHELAQGLTQLYQVPTQVPQEKGVFKLRLGPLTDQQSADNLLRELKQNGYQQAYPLRL